MARYKMTLRNGSVYSGTGAKMPKGMRRYSPDSVVAATRAADLIRERKAKTVKEACEIVDINVGTFYKFFFGVLQPFQASPTSYRTYCIYGDIYHLHYCPPCRERRGNDPRLLLYTAALTLRPDRTLAPNMKKSKTTVKKRKKSKSTLTLVGWNTSLI
jgi:hypothetical protein